MRIPVYTKRCVLFVAVLGVIFACLAGQRGLPPSEGILNFGRVNDTLYRGAQPDDAAVAHLKTLGVKMIINLRTTRDASDNEQAQAIASGIIYTNVPLAGLSRPTDEEVTKILSLIETAPGAVFVHCEHGCDRTGTIIACYRLRHDHWTSTAALQEANRYGMSGLERGMRRYVLDYAKAINAKTNQLPAQGVP